MIKLEHLVLPSPEQMKFVIEGMRNPMNSWDKSDSIFECEHNRCSACDCISDCLAILENGGQLGPDDLSLMHRLAKAGTDHRKFMRMMPVMVRITAPLYWWKEFDTYKVGTVANSCSTMHKITDKKFTLEDFSCEHLEDFHNVERYAFLNDYLVFNAKECLDYIITLLNGARDNFLKLTEQLKEEHDSDRREILKELIKKYWWQMIQLLPSSYNQTRNVMLNYEVLNNMYRSRKDHKLDEWRDFCKWMEALPYSELITGDLPQDEETNS